MLALQLGAVQASGTVFRTWDRSRYPSQDTDITSPGSFAALGGMSNVSSLSVSRHALAVQDGVLYAFGACSVGQLGLAGCHGPTLLPLQGVNVAHTPGVRDGYGEVPLEKVLAADAGADWSVAIAGDQQRVYTFGSCVRDSLGRPCEGSFKQATPAYDATPRALQLNAAAVTGAYLVAAGGSVGAAATLSAGTRQLLVWGSCAVDDSNSLSSSCYGSSTLPSSVAELQGEVVTALAASDVSLYVATAQGKLYSLQARTVTQMSVAGTGHTFTAIAAALSQPGIAVAITAAGDAFLSDPSCVLAPTQLPCEGSLFSTTQLLGVQGVKTAAVAGSFALLGTSNGTVLVAECTADALSVCGDGPTPTPYHSVQPGQGVQAVAAGDMGALMVIHSPGTVQFTSTSLSFRFDPIASGGAALQMVDVAVERVGGSLGATEVRVQSFDCGYLIHGLLQEHSASGQKCSSSAVVPGIATASSDYVHVNQVLRWEDGEVGVKHVALALLRHSWHAGDINSGNRTMSLYLSEGTLAAAGRAWATNVTIAGERLLQGQAYAPHPVLSPASGRATGSLDVTLSSSEQPAAAGTVIMYTVNPGIGNEVTMASYVEYDDSPVHLEVGVWIINAYIYQPGLGNSTMSGLYSVGPGDFTIWPPELESRPDFPANFTTTVYAFPADGRPENTSFTLVAGDEVPWVYEVAIYNRFVTVSYSSVGLTEDVATTLRFRNEFGEEATLLIRLIVRLGTVFLTQTSVEQLVQPGNTALTTFPLVNSAGSDLVWEVIDMASVPSWIQLPAGRGEIPPGGASAIPITLNAKGLDPGTYTAELQILTNDPNQPIVMLPITLQVTSVVIFPETLAATLKPADVAGHSVSVVNMRPLDLLVFLNFTQPDAPWLTFTVVPACIPSGSMGSLRALMSYLDTTVDRLGSFEVTLGITAFAVDDPWSGLSLVGGVPGVATCASTDTYAVSAAGVNASRAIDFRSLTVKLTALEGSARGGQSSVALTSDAEVITQDLLAGAAFGARFGQDLRFLVTARDLFGRRRSTGGDRFAVDTALRGVASIVDNQNGTYTVVARGTVLGLLPLRIRGSGGAGGEEEVQGSPVIIDIQPPSCVAPAQLLAREKTSCECAPGYGYYQGEASGQPCLPCPAGTSKNTQGDTVCRSCAPGLYAPGTGSLFCIPCPKGTTPSFGSEECDPAPAGTFAPTPGMSIPLDCQLGYFSYEGASVCQPCPAAGVECEAGKISLEEGWWREYPDAAITSNTIFLPCPHPDTCLVDGSWSSGSRADYLHVADGPGLNTSYHGVPPASNGTSSCAAGHTGPLCGNCIEGYALTGGSCQKCWSDELSWGATGAAAAVVLSAVAFMVHRNSKSARQPAAQGEDAASSDDTEVGNVRATVAAQSSPMGAIRVCVNFLQASSMLGSFRLKGPALLAQAMGFTSVGDGLSFDLFPIKCALRWGYYTKFFGYLMLPIVVVAGTALFYFCKYLLVKGTAAAGSTRARRLGRDFISRFVTAVIVVMFLIHQRLTKEVVSVFSTMPFTVFGKKVLSQDPTISTDTTEYDFAALLGVIGLVVYVIGFPAIAARMLVVNQDKLHTSKLRARLGFLYQGLKLGRKRLRYLYEVVWVMARKIGIVVIAVVVEDPFLQVFSASILLTLAVVVHLIVRPYDSKIMNSIESASLATMLFTQMGSILYWRQESADNVSSTFDTALTIILLALNAAMMLVFIVIILILARQNAAVKQAQKQLRRKRAARRKAGQAASRKEAMEMEMELITASKFKRNNPLFKVNQPMEMSENPMHQRFNARNPPPLRVGGSSSSSGAGRRRSHSRGRGGKGGAKRGSAALGGRRMQFKPREAATEQGRGATAGAVIPRLAPPPNSPSPLQRLRSRSRSGSGGRKHQRSVSTGSLGDSARSLDLGNESPTRSPRYYAKAAARAARLSGHPSASPAQLRNRSNSSADRGSPTRRRQSSGGPFNNIL